MMVFFLMGLVLVMALLTVQLYRRGNVRRFVLPRVRMAATLYQMKEHAASVLAELNAAKDELAQMLGDPLSKMEDNRAKKARVSDLKERYDGLMEQIADMEADAKARLKVNGGGDAQMSKQEAKGRFFQAVLTGNNVRELPKMVYEQLGAIPTGDEAQGAGSNFLPTQLSNELLMEPLVTNPLREFMTVTDIVGLELPKLGFSVDDDSFLTKDGQTAKELKLKGDKVTFGNKKMMLKAEVSESILRSSPINVEAAVSGGLNSAQAAKELKVIFSASPAQDEKAMSLYSTENAIKEVEGANLLDGILAAYGDLEDVYAANARVCMRRQDYIGMIRTLSNSEALFGKKPEDIIGVPVVFCDSAKQPVVGDFRFLHLNFNGKPLYDTDKDITAGNRRFVLTHWYDIKVKMASAFRRVKVVEA